MYNITSRWSHQSSVKVEWNLGKRCNYNCAYCPAEIHDNTSPHTDIGKLKNALNKLVDIGKPIRLSFTGGEPCVHPNFDELVKYAKHKGVTWISVTTNGTRSASYYLSLPVDQYVFSIHLEYDWKRVINTLMNVFQTQKMKLIGQIMAHHEYMNDARVAHGMLESHNVPLTVRRIRWTQGDHDLFDDMRYNPDDLMWIKSKTATVQANCVIDDSELYHANDVIKLHLNKFNGWHCNAGIESLMINWDGEVYRATCRVGGSLGNILIGTFEIPKESIICDRNFCTCAADIPLTKRLVE